MYNLLQLERELLLITNLSDSWTSASTSERWNGFASKFAMFAHLESKSNKKLKDMLTAHKSERESFPPQSEGM